MEEVDFINSGENGSKEKGIKDAESESKGQEPCNLQRKLDNAFVKTEIKIEDDDIYESASENDSIDGGNTGIERNGQEPCNLQGVLDNKIAKTEIIMEDDDIPNSSTESVAKSLKSRLLLNKIVPEHARRKHKATTDKMSTIKERTNNGWTKLNNVLFKDGILIDDTNFHPSFIQSNDTFYCNSAIQSGFNNNSETNENSFNKERREFMRKETVKVGNIGNNVQGRFKSPGIKTDIKIMMRCSVSLERLSCIEKYGREPSQGPNLESDHLVAIKDTVKEAFIEKIGQYHIQDPEVQSHIQIMRQCSVSLEKVPSIEKYCQVPFEYPIGVLPNMGYQQSGFIQVQTNDMSAQLIRQRLIDSTEVQDKVVSSEKDLHDSNQKIGIVHKNYMCNLCDETFTLESKYQVHLFYHTIGNIKCFKCHKMFGSGVALQNHMKTKHNEKPPQRNKHLSPVESDSMGKACSDEEVSTEEFQDLSDGCIFVDQDFSDEDDQPLSVLTKHNPLKYKVKNRAGSGKQVTTELDFQDIFLTENNGHILSEYRIKNKKVSVSSTSTDVIFHNLSDKYGNVNQQISVLIDTNINNRSRNKEVTDHSSEGSDEEVFNDAEYLTLQDFNTDKNVSESANYMHIDSGDMFTTTEELEKHEIAHKKYECDLCENVFNQYSKYQQHLLYHTNGDKLKCLHCKKSFDGGLTLKRHMQTRNCKQCRKCLRSSAALEQHMQFIHSGIHPYKCTKCDEGFLLAEELDKHSRIHSYKKVHTCPLCCKMFYKRGQFNAHFRRHGDKKDYKCTKCSKAFVAQNDLNSHMLFHNGVRNHICNFCSKAFLRRSGLNKHVRKHTGIQPHKCPLCDKRFSHIKRVKRHLVIIHYGKKEHKCIHCNECFALFPDLKRHYATHNDLRPYKCKECPKPFVTMQHLTTHMLSHSGVKPHQCVQCGTSFRLPHHLRNHLLTHSAKKRPKRK